jgi:methionyl-tRNA synthetase
LLRFYYALNLSTSISDIDLDSQDFREKINSELLGNIANLSYRSMTFLSKHFNGRLTSTSSPEILKEVEEKIDSIEKNYEICHLRNVVKNILEIGDIGNRYFQGAEPWKKIKTDRDLAWRDLSLIIQIVRDLTICLKPIIPDLCADLENQLTLENLQWKDLGRSLEDHIIGQPKQLLTRIETLELVTHNPFLLLDLRLGRVLEATPHPDADRLMILQVDIGDEKRQIVAGIKEYYLPHELIGRNIIILKNLKPARLKGIESQGMLLAADDGKRVGVLNADGEPGQKITLPELEGEPSPSLTIKDLQSVDLHSEQGKAFSQNLPLLCNGKQVLADGSITGKIK